MGLDYVFIVILYAVSNQIDSSKRVANELIEYTQKQRITEYSNTLITSKVIIDVSSRMIETYSKNRGNLSNFLNNEDADIINLNYKKEWNILFKNQIISGDYSKTPFLVRSAALYTEIMPQASIRQGLLFRKYKRKLTRSVNAENAVRQASKANASEGEDHNFFQIDNSNPNPLG
ncbi:hypothetical protein H8356DRAFT_1335177, partial [Neocallimastix lanati (nom. inval.)]